MDKSKNKKGQEEDDSSVWTQCGWWITLTLYRSEVVVQAKLGLPGQTK